MFQTCFLAEEENISFLAEKKLRDPISTILCKTLLFNKLKIFNLNSQQYCE